jgi:hypothetical protein
MTHGQKILDFTMAAVLLITIAVAFMDLLAE